MAQVKTTIGKYNSLFYALVVAGFLVWQSISLSYNKSQGWVVETRTVPSEIVTPCFVLMAVGLGLNVSEAIRAITSVVNRNSAAIATLSERTPVNTEIETSRVEDNEQN